MREQFSLHRYLERLEQTDPLPVSGRVVRTVGLLVESLGPRSRIGDLCELAVGGDRGHLTLMKNFYLFESAFPHYSRLLIWNERFPHHNCYSRFQ